jgi:hypothetical protein
MTGDVPVPNAAWSKGKALFGGEMDGGSKCLHGVYIPGPQWRLPNEDGNFAPYCSICVTH